MTKRHEKLLSVLVVDDQQFWRELVCDMLEGKFKITSVDSYDQALQAIKNEHPPFHVIVTDLRLVDSDDQNVDGLRVAEALKKLGWWTKIIVLTGYATIDTVKSAIRDLAVYDYLQKHKLDPGLFVNLVTKAAEEAEHQRTDAFSSFNASALIMEKNPLWRNKLSHLLQDEGFQIETIENLLDINEKVDSKERLFSLAVINEAFLLEDQTILGTLQQSNPGIKLILLTEKNFGDLLKHVREHAVQEVISLQEDTLSEALFQETIRQIFAPEYTKYIIASIEGVKEGIPLIAGETYKLSLRIQDFPTPNATPISLMPLGNQVDLRTLRLFTFAPNAILKPGSEGYWKLPGKEPTHPYTLDVTPQQPGEFSLSVEIEQDKRWLGTVVLRTFVVD